MEASVLLPLWRSGDVESLPDVLAEHATFSSPVADHNGQAKTAHMLGLIARVLEDVENAACSLSSGAACPVVAVIDSALRSAGLPSGRCEPAAGSRSLDSCVGGGGRYRRRRPARRRSATSEGAIPSSRLRVRYSIRFFSLIWCLVMTIRAVTCRSVRLPVSVRAENLVHGSDQHGCSSGRPAVMITDHVHAVRVPPALRGSPRGCGCRGVRRCGKPPRS